ncbi:MAG: tyrosine-protein phosphatase [Pseudomonadaceae bacterium]
MTSPTPSLLAGAANFRDLGGYRTRGGRTIRYGLLYRSEALPELNDEDLAKLRSLGIRLLCDMRSNSERQQTPNRWAVGMDVETLSLDIAADLRAGYPAITELLSGYPTQWHAEQAMLATYRLFPQTFASSLPRLFESILQDQLPLVFHCAAGKDRTGFIAALLLSVLEVPGDTILHDYMLSAERWRGSHTEAAIRRHLAPFCSDEVDIQVIRTLAGVNPIYLDAAFEVIESRYGTVEDYLNAAGIPSESLYRLRDRLLL